MPRRRTYGRWVAWSLFAVVCLSILTWHYTRERLPDEIRIATASNGGLYHRFASAFAPPLTARAGREVRLVETAGSRENCNLLLNGGADLAILQAGSMHMNHLVAIAPLYHEAIFVIAREGSGIEKVGDLEGCNVAVGPPGSGMRSAAVDLLLHYGISVEDLADTDHYFTDLAGSDDLDAAIVTTGLTNPDLDALLSAGGFNLVPIGGAEAFCVLHPAFEPLVVPEGLFGERPAVPAEPVTTVATTAFLAARDDVSDLLVDVAVRALYENDLRALVPTLLTPVEARDWPQQPLHRVSYRYLHPYDNIGVLANLMESLAATKELLFALAAGVFLVITRWRSTQARQKERELEVMKDRLDQLIDETAQIERLQMATADGDKLAEYLNAITRIKLRALDELAHEDLRSDQMFAIFLMQCGNVINKIQAKLALNAASPQDEPPSSDD